MASVLFFASQSGAGFQANLAANNDSAYVLAGVGVNSTDSFAVVGEQSYHTVTVEGIVAGAVTGVSLGNTSSEDHHQRLTVEEGGRVLGYVGSGAAIYGYGSRVNNEGTIFGATYGLFSAGDTTESGPATIGRAINSGTIEGTYYGIYRNGGEGFIVTNTGTIEGGDYSLYANDASGSLRINNTGQMAGYLAFGSGADTYDGRLGHIDRSVFGQAGGDVLMGGSEDNTLDGGLNNDTLAGGLGADTLVAGGGADTLVFDTALGSGNIDTMTDFNAPLDTIRLENAVFAKLGTEGWLDPSYFKANSAGAASQADDYILYNTSNGKLYYDADGNGSGAAIHFATLANKAALTAADFIVV